MQILQDILNRSTSLMSSCNLTINTPPHQFRAHSSSLHVIYRRDRDPTETYYPEWIFCKHLLLKSKQTLVPESLTHHSLGFCRWTAMPLCHMHIIREPLQWQQVQETITDTSACLGTKRYYSHFWHFMFAVWSGESVLLYSPINCNILLYITSIKETKMKLLLEIPIKWLMFLLFLQVHCLLFWCTAAQSFLTQKLCARDLGRQDRLQMV